ncbi:uncharacterized protein LOC143766127 [Ranitomeya variabilis]|uniref:uncharacterized protein LOC143766127 n=1 Tax=Ranitomeya variabilis TaxID=490064 RepID=UPI00405738E9
MDNKQLVVNISSVVLSDIEIKVLSKGLPFCPSNSPDWFGVEGDLQTFFRRLRLSSFFSDKVDKPEMDVNDGRGFTLKEVGLYNRSNFQPPNRNNFVESYIELVQRDIEKMRSNFRPARTQNVTSNERLAMKALAENTLLTIKPADKGGAVVVMDSTKYRAEIVRQLDDATVYEKLSCNPTLRFQRELQLVVSDSFRRGRNLRDRLVKSDIGPSKSLVQRTLSTAKHGNFPCLGCACCNNMLKGEFCHHPHTGKKIFLKERYTCSSSFVVYMIVCPCGLTYVGETTMEVRARISKHKSTVTTGLSELPVPKHFIESRHSVNQLRFRVIDSVPVLRRGGDRIKIVKKKELRWIYTLGSLQPKGLNIDFNFHACAS